MTALQKILDTYRQTALTNRESGTYFEKLILCYLKNEAAYKDLYSNVWMYADWVRLQSVDANATGIDLVQVAGTDDQHLECHAIQANYAQKTIAYKKRISTAFSPHRAKSPLATVSLSMMPTTGPMKQWGDAKYPLELLLRVVTVSLRTLDVVEGLPRVGV